MWGFGAWSFPGLSSSTLYRHPLCSETSVLPSLAGPAPPPHGLVTPSSLTCLTAHMRGAGWEGRLFSSPSLLPPTPFSPADIILPSSRFLSFHHFGQNK